MDEKNNEEKELIGAEEASEAVSDENSKEGSQDAGTCEYKPTLSSRIENFFYHYKWHTIVAAFVTVILIIVGVQMCSKDDYDSYILYAGGHSISRQGDSDVAEYVKITSAIKLSVSREAVPLPIAIIETLYFFTKSTIVFLDFNTLAWLI